MLPLGFGAMTAIAEWETIVLTIKARAEESLEMTAKPARIWDRNQVLSQVLATPPGEVIPGGQLLREEALMYSAMFQSLLAWLTVPIQVGVDAEGQPVMMTPRDVLDYRRPVAQAPA